MSAEPVLVRKAKLADLAQISDVFSRSFRTLSFLPNLHSIDEDYGYWRDVVLPQQTVLVAERGEQIVGVLAFAEGWINQLYVDPDRCGNGIGSALMAGAKGAMPNIQLWCFAENLAGRSFYEKHGFVVAEWTDGSRNEARCADIRFVWPPVR